MSRMTFADLVRGTGVNIAEEYNELVTLLHSKAYEVFQDPEFRGGMLGEYEERSFCNVCDENFLVLPKELRGTCRTMAKYNAYHRYFPERVMRPELDDLLMFAEYCLTFSCSLAALFRDSGLYHERIINKHILEHLNDVKDKLHHSIVFDGCFVKLVPEDAIVAEVASRLPADVSIRTFLYRHRSMVGKLDEKKHVLKLLGDQLEPRRGDLHDMELSGAIFAMLNQMNIRHNNTTEGDKNYRMFVAGLSKEELEVWYDRLYDMMLAAFSRLDAQPALVEYSFHKDEIGA